MDVRRLLAGVCVSGFLLNGIGCADPKQTASRPPELARSRFTWDCRRMRHLEEEMLRRLSETRYERILSDPKQSDFSMKLTILVSLLPQRLTRSEIYELIDSCKTMPRPKGLRSKAALISEAIIVYACEEAKDQDMLARMLSVICLGRVGPGLIEEYLALVSDDQIDGILALAAAFDRCRDVGERKKICDAFRRAFTLLGIKGRNDAGFVRECRRWYTANKEKIEIVTCYRFVWDDSIRGLRPVPLFVKKRPPGKADR